MTATGPSLPAMLLAHEARRAALAVGDRSWGDVIDEAMRVAAALVAGDIRAGDRVAVRRDPDGAWAGSLLGAQGVGAVGVLLDPAWPDDVAAWVVDHVDAVAVLGQSAPAGVATVRLEAADTTSLPGGDLRRESFESGVRRIDPGAVAQLVPTARTGRMAMLTHRNLATAGVTAARAVGGVGPDDVIATTAGRPVDAVVALALAVHAGARTVLLDESDFPDALAGLAPSVVIASSRPWEAVLAAVQAVGGAKRGKDGRRSLERLGLARVRAAVATGGPIAPEAVEAFDAAGVPLLRLYGTAETGGVATLGRPEHPSASVGQALPGVELRVASDGEVLVRSPMVAAGTFKEGDGEQRVDGDGWAHTGDLGVLDGNGVLTLLGRRDRLIRTATGELVDPTGIESRLRVSPHVKDAVVVDAERELVALVEVEPTAFRDWARDEGVWHRDLAGLARSRLVHSLVNQWVEAVNERAPEAARIGRFRLVPRPLAELGDDLERYAREPDEEG